MFAYCNNNPVIFVDREGNSGTLVAICGVSAVISGLANAISTASNGGSVEECIVAGLCGAAGGAVGAFIGVVTPIDPLRAAVLGRGVSTGIANFATAYALNGKVTTDDVIWTAVDITMDMTFSTIGYFYNPISDAIVHASVDAVADGAFDVAQTYLFTNDSNVASANTIMPHAGSNGLTRSRAQRKVGELLGIV